MKKNIRNYTLFLILIATTYVLQAPAYEQGELERITMQREHADKKSALKTQHLLEIDKLKTKQNSERQSLNSPLEKYIRTHLTTNKTKAEKIKSLETKFNISLTDTRDYELEDDDDFVQKTEELKHAKDIADLKKQHALQMNDLEQEHAQQIHKLEKKRQDLENDFEQSLTQPKSQPKAEATPKPTNSAPQPTQQLDAIQQHLKSDNIEQAKTAIQELKDQVNLTPLQQNRYDRLNEKLQQAKTPQKEKSLLEAILNWFRNLFRKNPEIIKTKADSRSETQYEPREPGSWEKTSYTPQERIDSIRGKLKGKTNIEKKLNILDDLENTLNNKKHTPEEIAKLGNDSITKLIKQNPTNPKVYDGTFGKTTVISKGSSVSELSNVLMRLNKILQDANKVSDKEIILEDPLSADTNWNNRGLENLTFKAIDKSEFRKINNEDNYSIVGGLHIFHTISSS